MSAPDLQDENAKEALITYEQLQDIQDDFEEVEVEIIRQQEKLTKDLYAKRQEVIAKIPSFWPLVLEQSPPDIDEYIQPSDSELLTSLSKLSVERFELPNGDPRSISITMEFKENDFFEDKVLEKKFWWRRANDGWAGHVSEPVDIKWKDGKDLTSGMLGLVTKIWEEEKAGKGKDGETANVKELKKKMEETGLGGVSFFAWFGFRGRKISDEEHAAATKKEEDIRQARKEGKKSDAMDEDDDEDDEDEDEYELEIFPTGDDLAVCIAEDLWPAAIEYFTNSQESDDLSEIDFESGDEMDQDDDEEDKPANKKRKA